MASNDPLTRKIIGCATKVHRTLGMGFQEVVYQRAVAIEFAEQGISFQRELEMDLYCEGRAVGTRRADLLVDDKIMVELKALEKIEDIHLVQGPNCLTAYNPNIGLLIKFAGRSPELKPLFRKRKSRQSVESCES